MRTVFLCHAKEDHELSQELAEFLERGAGFQVFLQDGEIGGDETLVSKAADGLQAEVILLVLSPHSVPARLARPEWEPALIKSWDFTPTDSGKFFTDALHGKVE